MSGTAAYAADATGRSASTTEQRQREWTNDRTELKGPFGRPALRIGRIFGIEIGLDWSWLFIFLLITFSLAQGFAHRQDWQPVEAWSAGVLASLLFFASIVLHELGHSLTSQALGLPVRSITLFIFGGLARLSGEPKRPRDEFLIAAAGPAVSVILGLGFLLGAALVPRSSGPLAVLGVVLGWLGATNLVLAAFNLVPGFPLDGGRLMRALVWKATGDFRKATYLASGVGALFAYLMIGAGISIALLLGALFNGLWLAFIGWFLLGAAQGSAKRITLERELERIAIRDTMETDVPTVSGDATVTEVLEKLVLTQGRRAFFVREADRIGGLVTLHQIKRVPAHERQRTRLAEIMLTRPNMVVAPARASLWDVLTLMNERGVSQVPVEQDGEIVGMLTRGRVIEVLQYLRELGGRPESGGRLLRG